ncbi:hypothetical protein [Desulfosporosinus metallidurans]|uniref:Uncharacterized protein n=1 Tax=Desulfosporosinus metallidurans TaxID=1888891 RepID=A0A1Q8R2K2_9FIRM|nr:hypothetical protein [Desulfosporosinus metallidurans]OLN33832.1 hypothetical protein DSOL_0010 [Desulfosporosinus metallidurans]
MRTLEQIREQNKRKDMLLTGMEEEPFPLSPEAYREGRELFENYIRPTARRVWARQLENGNLD